MRTIPKKNYAILGLLSVVTALSVIYMCNWYRASEQYKLENSVMKELVGELKEADFTNYIIDNPDMVIYIANDQSKETKKLENRLKKYILKENLKSHFIYVNGNEASEEFLKNLQNNYFVDKAKGIAITYPNLFILENGKIVDILYHEAGIDRNIKDVELFLQKNGVLEND